MNRRTKIILTIIFLLCVSAFGLAYAYFVAELKVNPSVKTVEVGSGILRLHYFDGNGEIIVDRMIPGNIVETKTFSVKNTGKNNIPDYDVYLDNIINDLEFYSDLVYTLTCREYDPEDNYVRDCNGVSEGIFPKNDSLVVTNSIEVGYEHKYELKITYKETYKDQSNDMKKTVKGRIGIYDDTEAVGG